MATQVQGTCSFRKASLPELCQLLVLTEGEDLSLSASQSTPPAQISEINLELPSQTGKSPAGFSNLLLSLQSGNIFLFFKNKPLQSL